MRSAAAERCRAVAEPVFATYADDDSQPMKAQSLAQVVSMAYGNVHIYSVEVSGAALVHALTAFKCW